MEWFQTAEIVFEWRKKPSARFFSPRHQLMFLVKFIGIVLPDLAWHVYFTYDSFVTIVKELMIWIQKGYYQKL